MLVLQTLPVSPDVSLKYVMFTVLGERNTVH